MNRQRFFLTICAMLAGVSAAVSQQPAPPVPLVPPVAPVAPFPPADIDKVNAQVDEVNAQVDEVNAQVDEVRAQMDAFRFQFDADGIGASAQAKVDALMAKQAALGGMFGKDHGLAFLAQGIKARGRHDGDDRDYERGQRALDSRNWEDALERFTQVASAGGSRADGALYWKAYALAKLGRRDEAVAAIAELRKSYATSRWLDDAKALELEVKQAGGQKMTPEAESDEDLKLMAINGLVQSDPERALPLVENLLKTSSSPKLKERALFVLAQSNSARGKQVLEQVARGGAGNPDLQLKAISYISAGSKKTDNRPLLWEIYSSSNDTQVKRAILHGLMASNDKEHLLQIAKTEKSPQLRLDAIAYLGSNGVNAELWQIYQGETSADVKQQILHSMISSGSADRLAEIAKTEHRDKRPMNALLAKAVEICEARKMAMSRIGAILPSTPPLPKPRT